MSIASVSSIVIDCRRPQALAEFYAKALGGTVTSADDTWATVESGPVHLAFQYVADYEHPVWPGAKYLHLDFTVTDRAAAVKALLELGATLPEHQPGGEDWTVMQDPAGHPFCVL